MLVDMDVKNMLEIGVSFGGSIKMWNEYFDNNIIIHGIDIEETRFIKSNLETENIKIHIGNQSSKSFLNKIFINETFDFIVDDGSHRMKHQQLSFKYLFNKLRNGGLYVIEDLHTSNIPSFYDSNPETTTLEMLENLRDGKQFFSNYINQNEYNDILINIESIKIFINNISGTNKKYIIGFIRKK